MTERKPRARKAPARTTTQTPTNPPQADTVTDDALDAITLQVATPGEHDLPWDQLPGETDAAYRAFLAYRAQPMMSRSLRKLAETRVMDRHPDITPEEMARMAKNDVATVGAWSSACHWQARVRAWDKHQADLLAAEARSALVDMHTRHAQVAAVALSKVVQRIQALDPNDLSARDMTTLMDVAVKIERLSRGDSSSNVDVGVRDTSGVVAAERPSRERLGDLLDALTEAGVVGVDAESVA